MLTITFDRISECIKEKILINSVETKAIIFKEMIVINGASAKILAGYIDNIAVNLGDTVIYNNQTYYVIDIEDFFNLKKIYLSKDNLFRL